MTYIKAEEIGLGGDLTNNHLLQQYARLTNFLGHTLGPDYEIVLHDFTDREHSIVAIANNTVSGLEIGAPLPEVERRIIEERRYEGQDFILHYRSQAPNGKVLRSSAFFIREGDELTGMLCFNFDDSRFRDISEGIMRLCHPDNYIETKFLIDRERLAASQSRSEKGPGGLSTVKQARARMAELGLSTDHLTPGERLNIVASLEANGAFMIRGAVKEAADMLGCSQATVYRLLQQVRER